MDYRAYPTQREAAVMLRVSASTLSRKHLSGVRVGRREIRLPAAALLEVARANNWVPIESLSAALRDYAGAHCSECAGEVGRQIDAWLVTEPRSSALDREAFLLEAARTLPTDLFDAVLSHYPPGPAQALSEASLGPVTPPSPAQEGRP
jgi:hypothetical protein